MRLRWFLAFSSVLLIVIGVTVVLHDTLDDRTGAGDQVVSDTDGGGLPGGDGTGGADGVDTEDEELSSGVLEVSGAVAAVHLDGAVLDPRMIDTPLTLGSERGFGNGGEITGVDVGGKPSSVVWDGGRPFVLSSGPGLLLDPVALDLVDGDLRCTLGGGAHVLREGTYQLDTPVAVGSTGVATPRDSVAFEAGPLARFEGHGDVGLVLRQDESHTFTGPGLVHLEGDLVVARAEGAQRATRLDLRSGAFELTFSPTEGGGWTVSGRVQSRIVGDLVLGTARRAGHAGAWHR